ncbi:MAG: lysophospholipid acyltransferase family protein [Gammaproteobacteria bacterium]|nr:lysophospholipid acyltransferase family protein [Gammaproteobacteria bacterium]MBQ0839486.1 lysophospholipid acyltransferase family protein [Gammaproteobacteria bacterium]
MGKRNLSGRVHGSLYAPRFWPSWLVVGLSWMLAKLPGGLQRSLSRGLARLLMKVSSARSSTIRRNIELCFPELSKQEQLALAEKNLASTILLLFDLLDFIWNPPANLLERGNISGEENLRKALDSGKPLIILAGHVNGFVLGFAQLTQLLPYHIVYRRMDNPVLEAQLYQRAARKYPITPIHRKEIPEMLSQLKKQGVVVIVPDQDFGKRRSVFIPFFGIQTSTITAIPQYAAIAGANVLTLNIARREGGRCDIEIEPMLENFPSGDDVADTQRWSDWLEASIRKQPEDYFWLHKRFKTRPEGEKKIY